MKNGKCKERAYHERKRPLDAMVVSASRETTMDTLGKLSKVQFPIMTHEAAFHLQLTRPSQPTFFKSTKEKINRRP